MLYHLFQGMSTQLFDTIPFFDVTTLQSKWFTVHIPLLCISVYTYTQYPQVALAGQGRYTISGLKSNNICSILRQNYFYILISTKCLSIKLCYLCISILLCYQLALFYKTTTLYIFCMLFYTYGLTRLDIVKII